MWVTAGSMPGRSNPCFPFGHGLSYTTFTYDSPRTGKETYRTSDVMTVSFRLSNTGKYPAREVVQLYVHGIPDQRGIPGKRTESFKDVQLEPGKSAQGHPQGARKQFDVLEYV